MGILHDGSIPVGFGMGLAMDLDAMERFSRLPEAQKEELINRARDAKNKTEMQKLLAEIPKQELR